MFCFCLLCDSLWHSVSCRIPFSRFLSHFHYCNLLCLWCAVVRSPLSPSYLSWMARVTNHLSSLPLTRSASTPEHRSASSCSLKWTRNRSALDCIIAEKIECCVWLKSHWNEMKHIFISCSGFCSNFRPLKCHAPWPAHVLQTLPRKHKEGLPFSSSLRILNNAPEISLASRNQCSFMKNLHRT